MRSGQRWLGSGILSCGGVRSRYVALSCASAEPVLIESTRGFTDAVESRNDLTLNVHHLTVCVDSQTGTGIMDERRTPGGVEGRPLNFVFGRRFAEIQVRAGLYKRVVTIHCGLQSGAFHRFHLIWIFDGAGE